ncbi:branched-chain amino acid ABC transporter substrate-binding protein [Mesorhizobium sp. M7A.F.Ca.US.011.01.1.1]|nr:branched-chain amino acid ABC transporter substrate-binding protein [Mesorhizobium sp. M7A.F.Ca.US.011.01.1.1]
MHFGHAAWMRQQGKWRELMVVSFKRLAKRLACATALAGLAMTTMAAAADIKIGIVAPMTGQLASEGQDMENAVKMAIDAVNAKGGVNGDKIITTTADDACDPQQAVTAGSKLVSEGVTAIVGGYCSGAVLPTLKIYGDAGIPFVIIGANSTKLVAANQGNAFLANSTGDMQATTAVELFKKNGYKKIAVVDEGDAYSSDLAKLTAEAFKSAGGEIAAKETTTAGEQDYSAVVTKIKSSGADAVFWTAYHAGGALLTKQLRQAGFQGGVVLGDGNNSPEYLEIAGSAGEGVYLLSPPTVDLLSGAADFKAKYKETYGRDAGAYAALSYDVGGLIADAITRAKSADQKAIIEALKASDFKGLAGEIKFTDKNTLQTSNFRPVIAKGGKWVAE